MLEDLIKQIIKETVMLTLEKTGTLEISKTQTPDIMTPQQLAEYLGMSVQWVYEKTKELPHEKRGRKTLFVKSEIDEWRQQQREEKESIKHKTVKISIAKSGNGLYKVI